MSIFIPGRVFWASPIVDCTSNCQFYPRIKVPVMIELIQHTKVIGFWTIVGLVNNNKLIQFMYTFLGKTKIAISIAWSHQICWTWSTSLENTILGLWDGGFIIMAGIKSTWLLPMLSWNWISRSNIGRFKYYVYCVKEIGW